MTTATPLPRSFRSRVLLAAACALLVALLGACSQTAAPPPVPAPTAVLSGGGSYAFGATIALDAGGSSGDDLAYGWSFDSAPAGAAPLFSSSGGSSTSFVPDAAGTYVVRVAVENEGGSDSATTTVVVEPIDLAGNWTVTLSISGSSETYPMTLVQSDSALNGTLTSPSDAYAVTGAIDGDRVELTLTVDPGPPPITLTFGGSAAADGSQFSGPLELTDGTTYLYGSYTAVRAP